jgi:hypothetical protein
MPLTPRHAQGLRHTPLPAALHLHSTRPGFMAPLTQRPPLSLNPAPLLSLHSAVFDPLTRPLWQLRRCGARWRHGGAAAARHGGVGRCSSGCGHGAGGVRRSRRQRGEPGPGPLSALRIRHLRVLPHPHGAPARCRTRTIVCSMRSGGPEPRAAPMPLSAPRSARSGGTRTQPRTRAPTRRA